MTCVPFRRGIFQRLGPCNSVLTRKQGVGPRGELGLSLIVAVLLVEYLPNFHLIRLPLNISVAPSLSHSPFHDESYMFNNKRQISWRVSRNNSVLACAEWGLALSCFPGKMSSWQFMSLYNPKISLHVSETFICESQRTRWHLWIPWIFSQYYAW